MTSEVVVHCGVVWAYQVTHCGWFRYIKAFPEAVTKKGEPDLQHESVKRYLKEKHG